MNYKKIFALIITVFFSSQSIFAATVFNPNQTLDPGASDPTCTLTTCYIQASTTSLSTGTIVNSTLRWNGTNWVENTGFLTDSGNSTGTNSTTTNTWVSNILSALTAIFTNLTSTNATITNSTSTNFATSLLTSSATSTFNGKVILNSAVQDSFGATGTVNQVLVSTGTSTKWATAPGSLPTGTATNTTLRWDGSAWVENTTFLADASGNATWTNSTSTNLFSTNASITNGTTTNFFAVLLNAITAIITNLNFTNATGSNATTSNFATTNLTASGTFSLATGTISSSSIGILNSSGTSTFNGKVILNAAVQDSYGATGTANQILVSTGTSTKWTTISTGAIASGTATNSTLRWDGSNWVENLNFTADAAGNSTSSNGTSTNYWVSNILSALTAIFTNLTSTNGTITNATTTNFAAGLQTTSGTSTFNGKVILNASVQDSFGATGTANQVLTTTGTSTRWVTISGSLASGTATNSTLRWSGSGWVENTIFTTDGTGNATTTNIVATGTASATNVLVSFATITNSTSTNIFSTNASITNGTTTNLFSVLLNAITGYITNLYSTNATITNATSSNIAVNNLIATSTLGVGTTTNIYGGALTTGTTLNNALVLASSTNLSTSTYALYNVNGLLYWNGSAVGGSATMPFSGLTAATGTNTLDNTNLAQVWNWSTATSSTALKMSAGSLSGGTLLRLDNGTGANTSGTLLSLQTSNATTGSALSIQNNGDFTSNLVNIQGGGTGNVLALVSAGNTAASTGNMLSIAITGSSNREQGLKITNAGNGLSLDIAGAIAFGGTSFDPASNYANNANPGNANLVSVISSVAPFYGITGISDLLGTAVAHKNGRILFITNGSSTAAFSIYNESASSTAANRILTGTGADLTVDPNATVQLIYDSFSSRWKVVGGSGGGSISVQTISASTTLTSWNQTIYVNTSAGNVVLTLPTAVGYTGKNITIKKTTNDTNWVSVVPASGQNIDNASTTVTLTSYLSAATVQSDGTNPKLISDIGAVGSEYGENSGITNGQTITTSLADISGSSFTLPSAGTWIIRYDVSLSTNSTHAATVGMYTSGDVLVPNSLGSTYISTNSTIPGNLGQTVYITTTGSATYKLKGQMASGASAATVFNNDTVGSNSSGRSKITWQKVSGYQPVIGQMVDYVYAEAPSGQSIVTTNTVISFGSNTQGNIPNSSGTFTLTAGKTYSLSAVVGVAGNGDYAYYRWYDVTNSTFIGSVGTGGNLASLSGVSRNAEAVYTPNSNVTVQVRVSSTGSGSPVTSNDADDSSGGHYASAVKIIQLGTTAMTGVSLSVITNAVANGSLDNTNYSQTWNWSTATNSNALALSANNLTTGSLLELTTTSANLNSINGLVSIQASSATSSRLFSIGTSSVGNVLSVFANGLVGIGTTSPSATLSLAGNIFASSTATSTFLGGGINLVSSSGNIPCFAIDGVCLTNNSSYQWATTTNNMIYYSSGNVGIGTTSPYANSKLTVAIPTETFSTPSYISGYDAGGLANSGTENINIVDSVVVGNYMYVVQAADASTCSATASSANGCEFKIFDISSTTAPVYMGGGDIGGTTNSGTNAANAPTAILVYGSYAYITLDQASTQTTCSTTTGNNVANCNLQVWNISNPSSPTYVMGADTDGDVNTGASDVESMDGIEISSDGNYIYTTQSANTTACNQAAGSAIGCEFKVWRSMEQGGISYYAGYDGDGFSKTSTGAISLGKMKRNGTALFIGSTTGGGNCSATGGGECDLKVASVADPNNVTLIGGVSACGTSCPTTGTVNEILFKGSTAYVARSANATACSATNASRQGCELQIYNISNSGAITQLHGYDAGGTRFGGTQSNGIQDLALVGDYLYAVKVGSATACSNTVGSGVGCEVMVFGATSTPYYAYGYDASGSQGSGTALNPATSITVSGSYLFAGFGGNATACSATVGSAIGCEIKIFQIGNDSTLGGYALSVIGRAIGTSWESFSDRNLKENFLEFGTSTFENILALKPTQYNFKGDSKIRYGFIAQEVQEVMPELVSENNGILSMDYMGLIAPTIKAIQELNGKMFGSATNTAVNIEELTASSTISVDTKLKALGTNMEEVNKLLAGLNDLNATSSTISTSTVTHVTTTLSNISCALNSQVDTELNGGIIKSITISTSTVSVNGITPEPTASCEVATYSTTTEEKVEMTFVGKLFARITNWLADSTNGITSIFAKNVNAEEKICLGQVGNQVCMTKGQLERILQNTGNVPAPAPTPTPEPQPNPEPNGGTENQTPTPNPIPEPTPEIQPQPEPAPTPAPETSNN